MTNEKLIQAGTLLLETSSLFGKVQDKYREFCTLCKAEGIDFKGSPSVFVTACEAIRATRRGANLWPTSEGKYLGHTSALKVAKEQMAIAEGMPKGKKRDAAMADAKERLNILKNLGAFSAHLSQFDSYEDLFADKRREKGPDTKKGEGETKEEQAKNAEAAEKVEEKRKEETKTSQAFSVKEHLPEFINFIMMDGEARKNPSLIAIAETLRDFYLSNGPKVEKTESKAA